MELEEAKQTLREVQKNVIYEEIGTKELEAIDIVLKELDKKDKIIDLMAEEIYKKTYWHTRKHKSTLIKEIKEYFYKQVEESDE